MWYTVQTCCCCQSGHFHGAYHSPKIKEIRLNDLKSSEIIGSRFRYTDSTTNDTIHGIITDYTEDTSVNPTVGQITVRGLVSEEGTATAGSSDCTSGTTGTD